jgi:hypothetical protein
VKFFEVATCGFNPEKLDKEVFSYLCVQAEKFHKSHTQIINDLVHEKLAVGV